MNRNLRLFLITFVMSRTAYADSDYVLQEIPSAASIGQVAKALEKPQASLEVVRPYQCCVLHPAAVLPASPSSESWLSCCRRGVSSLKDVAYQLLVSNRFFGFESGSCQSWATLLNVKLVQDQFINTTFHHTKTLLNKDRKSLISTKTCAHLLSEGWEYAVLKSALDTAAKLQHASGVEEVYLPFNLYLTNALTGEPIMHRVILEAKYNDSDLKSVRIIDPQTALSGEYLSNAKTLCEKAFLGLSSDVVTKYVAAGVQMPGTGNCQKMAACIAVESAEGKEVSDLSIREANAFCTTVPAANKEFNKPSNILQTGVKAFSSITRGLSSLWRATR